MNSHTTAWQRLTRWVASIALIGGAFVVASPPSSVSAAPIVPPVADRDAAHVTADALPTVQHNGVVWDQTIIGNTVYAAGEFTKARPAGAAPGVDEVDRTHLLAYDIETGELDLDFNVTLNAQVKFVTPSPDGSVLYIGGMFTQVDGLNRYRLAALDPTTGAPIAGFNAVLDYRVNSIVATADTVYVGGQFNSAGGNARTRLAAFSATDGSVLAWAPTADAEVHTIALSPDGTKIIAGGKFSTLNGEQARGSGAIDAVTGATLPWELNSTGALSGSTDTVGPITPYGDRAAFLEWTTDGTSMFGNSYHFGGSSTKYEGVVSVDPDDGSINWINDCHGDTYGNVAMNGYVYMVTHAHYCSNVGSFPQPRNWADYMQHSLSMTADARGELRRDLWGYATFPGAPAPSIVNWKPEWQIGNYTTAGMAGWTVEGNGEYLVVGGEFLEVNNDGQQGLVRFAVGATAPSNEGPRLGGASFVPEVSSTAAGEVRVTIPANYDRDNTALTYEIIRDGNLGSPVSTQVIRSTEWDRPNIGFTDTGLTPGASHTYRIRVSDPDGNVAFGNTTAPVVVASTGNPSPYAEAVMADAPTFHWRFQDQVGDTEDIVGVSDGDVRSNVTRNDPGAIADGAADGAFGFTESSAAVVYEETGTRKPVIDVYSLEAWVKTSSTDGGRILGFSGTQTGTSSAGQSDRHLYMTNDGSIRFGIRQSGSRLTIQSPAGLNDGEWHHVVGTADSGGLSLYIDGQLVDSRTDAVAGDNYYGYWRVGTDRLSSWPGGVSSDGFTGSIDEVAVYEFTTLTPAQVASHFLASGQATSNLPPTAAFTFVEADLDVEFDASTSTDFDGSIVSYSWDFDDGSPLGSGVTPMHTYAAAGTYDVTLTVTDDAGGTDTAVLSITVEAPNAAPTAAFERTDDELVEDVTADFDAATSSDSDGTIESYVWDFGDGSPAGSGVTASHTYAGTGTYRVTLTVTDDDGASSDVFADFTVLDVNVDPTAAFTSSATFLAVDFDGSSSSDSDGSIASYSWDFGDGSPQGSGVTPSHTYAAEGTFSVTLTVTDDRGGTDTFGADVTVEAENVAPTAAFTSSATFLAVDFDGSSSSDSDGSIASYSWDFGDGSPLASGVTPSHTYAAEGTFSVTLTVTDDEGATSQLSENVTVEAENNAPTAAFTSSATFLAVDFDGSTSSDSDGSIASYSWDFGDGSPLGSGVTPNHTYGSSGTYSVTLTVTDDEGATGAVTKSVTVDAANIDPTAAFTESINGLTVDVDATTSNDPDGSIASYSWDFGDGSPLASGVTASHVYASSGSFVITLTVTDDDGATGTATSNVSVVAPNVAPTADFTATPNDLDVDFDASTSNDADGSIASYSWDFGDGSPLGSGVAPTHTYAASGTFSVVLTVTDDGGLTDDLTIQVTVVDPNQVVVIADDAFGRTQSNAWGSADVGGAWTNSGDASFYGVDGDAGTHTLDSRDKSSSFLNAVDGGEIVASIDFSYDKPPTGGGTFTWLAVRRNGSEDYRARVRISGTSAVLSLQRHANGSETTLAAMVLSDLDYQVGDELRLVLEAQGSSPTTLRAKVWEVGTPEPAGWMLTASDATASLQDGGGIGLISYLSGSATDVPVRTSFDDLLVQSLQPVANLDPTAAFTASASNLFVSTDGTASSDADGSIVAYSWDFDGTPKSGPMASHTFPAAGTYPVTLSVVDNLGATDSTTQNIVVTEPVVGSVAEDAFGRTEAIGWGNADLGGAWALSGSPSSFSVDGNVGVMEIPQPGRQRGASLAGVSADDVEVSVALTFDVAPTGGGGYHRLLVRQDGNTEYQLRLRTRSSGTSYQIIRTVNGASTTLANQNIAGYVYSPGDVVFMKLSATGSGVTQLNGVVWVDGVVPEGPGITVTDSTPELQGSGAIGLRGYISASAVDTPTVVTVDDFVAVTA